MNSKDSFSKELFLEAIKNQDYELKIAIAIFMVITWKLKLEMYPLIKNEIGKVRKRFFFPLYPNIYEEREIIKSLSKISFVWAICIIRSAGNDRILDNLIGNIVELIKKSSLVDIGELDELSEMKGTGKDFLQRIAFDIIKIIDWPDPTLSVIISLIISNSLPFIVGQSINAILSCSKDDLVPTVFQLNGW